MAERSSKKQKTASRSQDSSAGTKISDPRFANIQSDPRYRLPGRKHKVKLDKRFSRVLEDDDFTKRAKVDRYGRPLESDAEKKRLKRKYEFDDESEAEDQKEDTESDQPDDDEEIQAELDRLDNNRDILREGRDSGGSSSDETSSDEEEEEDIDEEAGVGPKQQNDVPMGEVTSRIAVVNLDWDNIRAADLMAVFNSFLPPSGSLLKVAIYPSEFGKERLEREEMEGPPKEIFARKSKVPRQEPEEDLGEEEEEDEDIKKSMLKPDEGADFDSAALRQYQLERLRYFYAVLLFSSPTTAKHIYDAVDGTEYLTTANFFDLRFIPDDTDFSTDNPREECTRIPDDYRPNEFVTDALQHSKVKLTWDAEDGERKEAVARAFKGGRKEIEEMDLKAYLGSDTSDDDDDEEETRDEPEGPKLSKKDQERQRMRALLGLGAEPEKKPKKDKAPVGDMQITFTSGLSTANEDGKKRSVFENSPEPNETTMEKYVRKERERKQRRKEKQRGGAEEAAPEVNNEAEAGAEAEAEEGDLGFNDPFFAEPTTHTEKTTSSKTRKEERLKKKAEREAQEQADQKQRAELELLMADDNGDGTRKMQHFDMKEIERAERHERRKDKKTKKGKKDKKSNKGTEGAEDDFKVDTTDPRFARLFESHEYAIDPTNPRFKGTKGMKELLDEGRKRKSKTAYDRDGIDGDLDVHRPRIASNSGSKSRGDDGESDVKSLVAKIKRREKR
jgi:hypothetical protein